MAESSDLLIRLVTAIRSDETTGVGRSAYWAARLEHEIIGPARAEAWIGARAAAGLTTGPFDLDGRLVD